MVLILSQPCPHSWAVYFCWSWEFSLRHPEINVVWIEGVLPPTADLHLLFPAPVSAQHHPVWHHHTLLLPGCQQPMCKALLSDTKCLPVPLHSEAEPEVMFFLVCLCLSRKLHSGDIYSLSSCEGTIIETKGCFLSFSQAAAALAQSSCGELEVWLSHP